MTRIDWASWLGCAVTALGLSPDQFWSLTPREFWAIHDYKVGPEPERMTIEEFKELKKKYG